MMWAAVPSIRFLYSTFFSSLSVFRIGITDSFIILPHFFSPVKAFSTGFFTLAVLYNRYSQIFNIYVHYYPIFPLFYTFLFICPKIYTINKITRLRKNSESGHTIHYFIPSFSLISTLRILPLIVLGSSSTNSMILGYL